MKGIILAGGLGTRLHPLTKSISKQILPIYDKPMIYYPLSVLMLAKIREVAIITTKRDKPIFMELLGNGKDLGMEISYIIQDKPRGVGECFLIAEDFIGKDDVALVLGDNIFFGQSFTDLLKKSKNIENGANIFGYAVKDPSSYGVVEFDEDFKVLSLEEKPKFPKSKYAVPGLYFYDNSVVDKAKKLVPSSRGELEITDINKLYLKENRLNINILGRGFAWLDTGTHKSLLQAGNFIETIQERQGNYVACIEEIAYINKWIDKKRLLELAKPLEKTEYGQYLLEIIGEDINGKI